MDLSHLDNPPPGRSRHSPCGGRPLRVEVLGSSRAEARLGDFLHLDGWDAGEWRTAQGERVLVLSQARRRGEGWVRRRDRYVAASRRRLDATRFLVADEHLVEYAHAQGDGPFERLAQPIVLPGRLRRGEARSALGVRLLHCGPVRLCCGEHSAEVDGLLLDAGGNRQWFVRGVGEVWLGRGDEPLRWMVGWRAGARTLLAGVRDDALPPAGAE